MPQTRVLGLSISMLLCCVSCTVNSDGADAGDEEEESETGQWIGRRDWELVYGF